MIDSRVLRLLLAKGVGDVTVRNVFVFLKNANRSIDDLFASKEFFLKIGIKHTIIESILSNEIKQEAARQAYELDKQGVEMVTSLDVDYPSCLLETMKNNYPPVLFIKGNASLLNSVAVGFCGSRKASAKGIHITEDCSKQLVTEGITVVSGYAAGTDLAAHGSALKNGGNTVFVLSEGILRYSIKKEVRELLNERNHVFVSQFLPSATWNVGNAMKRNGVIIGLSRAMILVESGKTGGTFAAGEESLKVGCPLFVVDFEKPEVSAEANPYFIKAGGWPIRGKGGIPSLGKVFRAIQDPGSFTSKKQSTSEMHPGVCMQTKLSI